MKPIKASPGIHALGHSPGALRREIPFFYTHTAPLGLRNERTSFYKHTEEMLNQINLMGLSNKPYGTMGTMCWVSLGSTQPTVKIGLIFGMIGEVRRETPKQKHLADQFLRENR